MPVFIRTWTLMVTLFFLLVSGCAHKGPVSSGKGLSIRAPAMGYSIQAGAFSRIENAIGLTHSLESRGIDAFYFADSSGLFKVRFGNYATREEAASAAESLRSAGSIDVFAIVSPGDHAPAHRHPALRASIRDDLVRTARSFIGIPYQWGSSRPGDGLDCSGLVLAVYRLNGLSVPRTSRDQFSHGTPVVKNRLAKGDLVFFATGGMRRISHVGIYIGNNRFIHAPGTGKAICAESLSSDYFRGRFMGACTYLN